MIEADEIQRTGTRTEGAEIKVLADQAVAWVGRELRRRYAELPSPFGHLTRQPTRQELQDVVALLGSSIAVREPALFASYLAWFADVLRSRGQPVQTVAEALGLLGEFLDARLPEHLARAVDVTLAQGARAIDRPASATDTVAAAPDVTEVTRALIGGDAATPRRIVEQRLAAGDRYPRIAAQVLQPALYEVGLLWQRNHIGVAQEHQATAVVRSLMLELYAGAPFAPPTGRVAVLASVSENHHTVGQRMVGDALEMAGWNVEDLGADVSAGAILNAIEDIRPDMLGLSVSMGRQLPAACEDIERIKAELGAGRPEILVGGLATREVPDAWRRIGADGWLANAEQAYEEAS